MAMLVFPFQAFSADISCKTKYPIVLAHGIAMNDIPDAIEYFNDVKKALEARGATVYISQVDKIAATGTKAYQFVKYLETQVFSKGHAKVNVIGHSHGGIYPKYAMKFSSYTSPKYGTKTWTKPTAKIASMTQIDSPNQGTPVADFALGANTITLGLVDYIGNELYTTILGSMFGPDESDVYVDSKANAYDLTLDGGSALYKKLGGNAGISGVYSQSYMHRMKSILCLPVPQIGVLQILALTMPIQCNADTINYKSSLGPHDPSDGVVSVKSATWANFRGVDDGGIFQIAGVDHCNATGQPFGWTGFFKASDKYVNIVKNLKAKGY
jgi:triacylglycerol lipase